MGRCLTSLVKPPGIGGPSDRHVVVGRLSSSSFDHWNIKLNLKNKVYPGCKFVFGYVEVSASTAECRKTLLPSVQLPFEEDLTPILQYE